LPFAVAFRRCLSPLPFAVAFRRCLSPFVFQSAICNLQSAIVPPFNPQSAIGLVSRRFRGGLE